MTGDEVAALIQSSPPTGSGASRTVYDYGIKDQHYANVMILNDRLVSVDYAYSQDIDGACSCGCC